MTGKEEQNLIIRITAYGLEHNRFVYKEMASTLKIESIEEGFVYGLLTTNTQTENTNQLMVCVDRNNTTHDWRDFTYAIVPTALYNYIDYIEIVEARKQATEARKQANESLTESRRANKQSETAIRLSTYAIVITVALGVLDLVFRLLELLFQD